MAADRPQEIRNLTASKILELWWQDGTVDRLPHRLLRTSCQCAHCKTELLKTGSPPVVESDVALEQIVPVGDYGLLFMFTDGHNRGIYPWTYLRKLTDDNRTITGVPLLEQT